MGFQLISCIVPAFNAEKTLFHTVRSILDQTYSPLEIIVVDDGSTDETPRVATRFGSSIRFLRQPNAGPPAARNAGLQLARGDFIAFLDADDLWHPDKLSRQMSRFRARLDLGVSVTLVQNFSAPQGKATPRPDNLSSRPPPGYVSQALLARKSVFSAVGPFREELLHTDKTEWFLRSAQAGVVAELLPEVLVYRRLHCGNLSRTRGQDNILEYLLLLKDLIRRRRTAEK